MPAFIAKRYKRAPIVEAVIEIRVAPQRAGALSQKVLGPMAMALKGEFPKQAPMQMLQMGVAARQPGAGLTQSFSQADIGFRLSRGDDSRVLQIRQEGFAYSHLAPYSDWKTFRGEAQPLWEQYRALCPDAKLTRCALRYINRIDIPANRVEIEDYFELCPRIPKALPQSDVSASTMSLQMPQVDLDCVANINQGLSEPVKPDHISFILDIDVFKLGIESWHDADLWPYLDRLRVRKNEIFEACITDRTRELIDR
jgi:uncharacterized protein (TIGR04255 family)